MSALLRKREAPALVSSPAMRLYVRARICHVVIVPKGKIHIQLVLDCIAGDFFPHDDKKGIQHG